MRIFCSYIKTFSCLQCHVSLFSSYATLYSPLLLPLCQSPSLSDWILQWLAEHWWFMESKLLFFYSLPRLLHPNPPFLIQNPFKLSAHYWCASIPSLIIFTYFILAGNFFNKTEFKFPLFFSPLLVSTAASLPKFSSV